MAKIWEIKRTLSIILSVDGGDRICLKIAKMRETEGISSNMLFVNGEDRRNGEQISRKWRRSYSLKDGEDGSIESILLIKLLIHGRECRINF